MSPCNSLGFHARAQEQAYRRFKQIAKFRFMSKRRLSALKRRLNHGY